MELIKIEGEDFRVLDYSKPGVRALFYMPAAIGAGYRRMVEKQTATNAIQSGNFGRLLGRELKKHKPNGLSDSDWLDQCKGNAAAAFIEDLDLNDSPDKDLAVLEVLLTPAPDSIPVKKWYMNYAEDSEVTEILNFLSGNVPAKIKTAPTRPSTGKGSKATRKAAV